MMVRILILAITIPFILISCTLLPAPVQEKPQAQPVQPVIGLPQGTDGYPWWNDTVFYEIFVRSFYDSNGDGIGDINGIIEKLDYLNDGNPDTSSDLGITGIWLMPIHPSPSYHGYDVTDYYSVNPDYGTIDDFKRLLVEAHKRGIRVVIDLVLNHTSSEHPWFIESRDPESRYRDWYIWVDEKPPYLGPWLQPVWHGTRWGFYYALFWNRMPDLNYKNPEVTAQMEDVVRFWLQDIGVDGFRLDAAKHLLEEGALQENTDSTHAWFQQFRPVYKAYNPDAMIVGEFFGDDLGVLASYTQGDQLDLTFNFDLASSILKSAINGKALHANGSLKLTYKLLLPGQYATFLTNHDQDRVMSQLDSDIKKAKVAASILLTSPGVPFIYYGEELGQEGRKPDENIRRPMQWTADKHAGFSQKFPWRSPGSNFREFNVALQTEDPESLLTHYRQLITLRNQHAALRVGETTLLQTGHPAVFANLRKSDNETLLVLINLSDLPVEEYNLSLEESTLPTGSYLALTLIGSGEFSELKVNDLGFFDEYRPVEVIEPFSTIILQLRAK